MLPAIPGLAARLVGSVRTRLRRARGGAADRSALVEGLDAAAVRVDGAGCVVDLDQRACDVLGVERRVAVGRRLEAIAPGLAGLDDPDGAVVDLPVEGVVRQFEVSVPWRATDGDPRGGETGSDEEGEESDHAGADGGGRWLLLRDVTDVEARRARERDLEQYETIVETVPVGVFVLDEAGAIVAGNERGASMLGYDLESVRGRTFEDLQRDGVVGPGFPDHETVADALAGTDAPAEARADAPTDAGSTIDADALADAGVDGTAGTRTYELTVRPADGREERVVEAQLALRPGEQSSGVIGVLRDVTDRQRRLDELEQYEAIMEVLPDPVYATDAEGRLTFVNRAFEEQLGYALEAGETHFSEFTTPEDTEAVLELLREMVGDGGPERATAEITLVTGDGRQLGVEDSIALLPGDGEFRGSAGVLRDVTGRKRRQEVLTVMNRALRHNLRTNVTTIVGYADLLDREVEGEAESFVQRVRSSAEWLAKLGDTLRTLQRAIEANVADDAGVGVEEVVESVAADAREAHPAADVTVHVATTGVLEAGWPLRVALEDVVENAIVHNDRAEPEVAIWVADAPRTGWVDIHVEDDGPGIPAEERDVVLGDAAITQLQHGSGIGLWLTRWLVEVFDGELVIEDNGPRGTVVTLRLPRTAAGESVP